MRIAYIFNQGRMARVELVHKGAAPKEFFLGAIEIDAMGHEVDMFEVDEAMAPGWVGGIANMLQERGKLPEKLGGGVLSEVSRLVHKLNTYDVIVGTTSGIGFALAAFRRVSMLRSPVVAVHCGLVNNSYGLAKKALTRTLLSEVETVLYGEGEKGSLLKMFPSIKDAVHVNQFGVDRSFWSPGKQTRKGPVLSVGNDGRRDYASLLQAARRVDSQFNIITSIAVGGDIPANVTFTKGSWHSATLSDADLRDSYRNASCVVVPLKESYQPSGQSVTLQALSCGTPVVLTETKGLWCDEIRNYVRLVPPGDSEKLGSAIEQVIKQQQGISLPAECFRSEGFADRMLEIIQFAKKGAI